MLLFVICYNFVDIYLGTSWSYDRRIYNCLWIQCLSPLKLWVRIPLMREVYPIQHYVMKFVCNSCNRSVGFSGPPVSSTNKIYLQDITKILLKVAFKHHNPTLVDIFHSKRFTVVQMYFGIWDKLIFEWHMSRLILFSIGLKQMTCIATL